MVEQSELMRWLHHEDQAHAIREYARWRLESWRYIRRFKLPSESELWPAGGTLFFQSTCCVLYGAYRDQQLLLWTGWCHAMSVKGMDLMDTTILRRALD